MLASLRSSLRAKRPFCSATPVLQLRSTRPSSNSKPPTDTDAAISAPSASSSTSSPLFGLSQPAPNTSSIPPADISYSRFISRHGPLEVANRLLHPHSQNSTKAISLRQRQQAAQRARGGNGERVQDLGESIIWQSATGAELELARVPHAALKALHAVSSKVGVTRTTRGDGRRTSARFWPRSKQEQEPNASVTQQSRFSSAVQRAMEQQQQQQEEEYEGEQENEDDASLQEQDVSDQQSMSSSMNRIVVVPFSGGNGGSQDFYKNLMQAVESGLRRVESYSMTSTKRKRRLKMNKHKFKKRRKEQESMRKKLGK